MYEAPTDGSVEGLRAYLTQGNVTHTFFSPPNRDQLDIFFA